MINSNITFDEFYKDSKARRIARMPQGSVCTIKEFFNVFIDNYVNEDSFRRMNSIIIEYANDPDAVFLVRQYESTRKKDSNGKKVWNTRRGAITRFADKFEYVYTSNFVAKNFIAMSIKDIALNKNEFKEKLLNRSYPMIIGTTIDKEITGSAGYKNGPSALSGRGLYLAHIEDVNGCFLRDNGENKAIGRGDEHNKLYPIGNAEDWTKQKDHIRRLDYSLTVEQKDIVKAHFIRFMSPFNYFLTPGTKYSSQNGMPMVKNIGEDYDLKIFMMNKYLSLFGNDYKDFMKLARIQIPSDTRSLDELGKVKINLSWR